MDIKKFERISKALSDPNRLCILQELKKKNDCLYCTEIQDFVVLAQPSISHHVKQLTDADLIIPTKEGRNLKYTLNEAVLDEYIGYLNKLKS